MQLRAEARRLPNGRSFSACPETVVSELIPVLATAGVLPLVVALSILRGWSIARGLALLLATVAAIVTRKEERRKACLEVVDMVTRKDKLPAWPHRKAIGRRT